MALFEHVVLLKQDLSSSDLESEMADALDSKDSDLQNLN